MTLNEERSEALGLAAAPAEAPPAEVAVCQFQGGLLSVSLYGSQDNREGPKPFVVRGAARSWSLYARAVVSGGLVHVGVPAGSAVVEGR
jgi:hypothetical protein